MKKLQSRSGETLIEALAAVLMVTIILMGLTAAVVGAARVNAQVRDADTSFQYSAEPPSSMEIAVYQSGTKVDSFRVDGYTTENGYHYYQFQEAGN